MHQVAKAVLHTVSYDSICTYYEKSCMLHLRLRSVPNMHFGDCVSLLQPQPGLFAYKDALLSTVLLPASRDTVCRKV